MVLNNSVVQNFIVAATRTSSNFLHISAMLKLSRAAFSKSSLVFFKVLRVYRFHHRGLKSTAKVLLFSHIRKKYAIKSNLFAKKHENIWSYQKKVVLLHRNSQVWYLARAVRDRSAKPGTAVRIRQVPQEKSRSVEWLFLV